MIAVYFGLLKELTNKNPLIAQLLIIIIIIIIINRCL